MTALGQLTPRRRVTDQVMRGVLALGTIIALIPLVAVIYYLLEKGLGAWSWDFFTTDPTGNFLGDQGGVKSALLGTIEMVALAAVVAKTRKVCTTWFTESEPDRAL